MSRDDVHPDVTDAAELDALLGADLRAARDAQPLPVLGVELAAIFADGLPPVSAPAPAPAARRRRRTLRRALVGAGVLLVGTSGLGVAGALPGPVQGAVADVAGVVGIDLPGADDDDEPPVVPVVVEVPDPTSTTTTTFAPPRSTVVPPSTVPPARPATPSSKGPPAPAEAPHDRGRGEERREEVRPEDRGRPPVVDDEVEAEDETDTERGVEAARGRARPPVSLPAVVGQEKSPRP